MDHPQTHAFLIGTHFKAGSPPPAAVAASDDAAALRAAGQQGLTERAERRPN